MSRSQNMVILERPLMSVNFSFSSREPFTDNTADCVQIFHRSYREPEVRNLSKEITRYLNAARCRYGWFWECPNGGAECQYRHALPPGFVLKSHRKAAEDAAKANVISIEDFLEVEVRLGISSMVQNVAADECTIYSGINSAQTLHLLRPKHLQSGRRHG